ncbi:MAG: RloB family protein [bacterium]|nr:RloB family protein [bacterium]
MAKTSSRRSREQRTLRRRVAHRVPKRTFLVFCEGEKTEPAYLKALKRDPEVRDIASVDIRIHDESLGSAPLTLVEAAADARARASQEESEIDEVWCLFDVEWPKNHPNLKAALALAKTSEVNVAVSNPCFELWLVLHFQNQTASLETKPAKSLLKKHDDTGGPGLDGSVYMPLRAEASRRARSLEKRHRGGGTKFPNDNPSSGMYRFLDAVEQTEVNPR